MRYLLGNAPTELAQGHTSQTAATVQHAAGSDKAAFQDRCVT